MDKTILNFANTKPTAARSIAEALAVLAAFTPPPKPRKLVAAEAERRRLAGERDEARDRERGLISRYREGGELFGAPASMAMADETPRPTREEVNAATRQLDKLKAEIGRLRAICNAQAVPWRHAYGEALTEAMTPLRAALSAAIDRDWRPSLDLIDNAWRKSSDQKVDEGPWLGPRARRLLFHLEHLRRLIRFERIPNPTGQKIAIDIDESLAAAIVTFQAFTPPVKSPELAAAEAERRQLQIERDQFHEQHEETCRRYNAAAGPNRPTLEQVRDEGRRLEELKTRALFVADRIEALAGPWRHAYGKTLIEAMAPLRVALCDISGRDWEAVAAAVNELWQQAIAHQVDAPWLWSRAPEIVFRLSAMRRVMCFDNDIREGRYPL